MSENHNTNRLWIDRPPDERFIDLGAMHSFVQRRRESVEEVPVELKNVTIGRHSDDSIVLQCDHFTARFTHWSFTQLCGSIGAPTKYLRTLSPELVSDCLNYHLRQSLERRTLLLRLPDEDNERLPVVGALTSPSYGRIWDGEIIGRISEAIRGTSWSLTPARQVDGRIDGGLYTSDRDMYIFLLNEENPIEIGKTKLGRGFFVWNSETGAAAFGIRTFLFNYACSNRLIINLHQIEELRILHRTFAPDRFLAEALPMLTRFVTDKTDAIAMTETIHLAMSRRIGDSLDAILKWFASRPFTKHEVTTAYHAGMAEHDDTTTVWGMVQGLTAIAREQTHADKRVDLERRAGTLLSN